MLEWIRVKYMEMIKHLDDLENKVKMLQTWILGS